MGMPKMSDMLLTLIVVFLSLCGQEKSNERNLTRKLLEDYVVSARPVRNDSQAVNITFGATLLAIERLDEASGSLTINLWLNLEWSDYYLRWDANEWGGVNDIRLRVKDIWVPDIELYNVLERDLQVDTLAVVTSSGSITYIPPYRMTSTCKIDTTWFPFDDQFCDLKFGSWVYNGLNLNLKTKSFVSGLDISSYIMNPKWILLDTTENLNEVFYDCCPEPYQDITFTIKLRRRTASYWTNHIVPSIAITFVSILTLLIPATSPTPRFLAIFLLFVLLIVSSPKDLPKPSLLSCLLGWCFFIIFSVLVHSILVTSIANALFLKSHSFINKTLRTIVTRLSCTRKDVKNLTEEQVRYGFANICDNFSILWISAVFLFG